MRRNALTPRLLCLGLFGLLGLAACTNPRSSVELYYPPKTPAHKIGVNLSHLGSDLRPSVHVLPFEDVRSFRRVGEYRTDWGFHAKLINPSNSVGEWFRAGLSRAIEDMGFELVSADAAQITLGGKLREAFVSKRFFYDTRLDLHLVVRCGCHGKILVSRELKLESSLKAEENEEYAEALAEILEHTGEAIALELEHLRMGTLHRTRRDLTEAAARE